MTLLVASSLGAGVLLTGAIGALRARTVRIEHEAVLLSVLSAGWRQTDRAASAALARRLDAARDAACGAGVRTPSPGARLDRWVQRHPGTRVELTDAAGRISYTSALDLDALPLARVDLIGAVPRQDRDTERGIDHGMESGVDRGTERGIDHGTEHGVDRGTEHGTEHGTDHGTEHGIDHDTEGGTNHRADLDVARFMPVGHRRYGWIGMRRIECAPARFQLLWLEIDAQAALDDLGARLGGALELAGPGVGALYDAPRATAGRLPGPRALALPLVDAASRPVAMLFWRPDAATAPDATTRIAPAVDAVARPLFDTAAGSPVAADRRWRWQVAGGVALLLLALLAAAVALRALFAPLGRSVAVLAQLARGRHAAATDAEDGERRDEAGAIARDVTALRGELLHLQMLRDERERGARQQDRLIRRQLRTLADALDEAERNEVVAWLDGSVGEGAGTLADLAVVLARLSDLITTQHDRLRRLLAELALALENETRFAALRQELEIARRMQLSILPRAAPDVDGIELAARIIPAREVGGDFYDYFMIDDTHLGVVVADVSGKGVPAAFFMAVARSLLKNTALLLREPGAAVARLNELLCEDNAQLMFVTLFFGVLNVRTGALVYVNAGHNPPLHVRAGAAPCGLRAGRNMALGVVDAQTFHADVLSLAHGDVLFLYTDGVTEAQAHDAALFGEAALRDVVRAAVTPHAPMREVNEAVIAAVRDFERGAPQADDITCLALRYASHPSTRR